MAAYGSLWLEAPLSTSSQVKRDKFYEGLHLNHNDQPTTTPNLQRPTHSDLTMAPRIIKIERVIYSDWTVVQNS